MPAMTNRYQLARFSFGKGQVARAQHQRDDEIAERDRNGRNQEKPHHHHAVHGEQPVIGLRRVDHAFRHDQVVADQRRRGAADEEEDRDGAKIEHRDPLVIGRQQPAAQGEAIRQVGSRAFAGASMAVALMTGSPRPKT